MANVCHYERRWLKIFYDYSFIIRSLQTFKGSTNIKGEGKGKGDTHILFRYQKCFIIVTMPRRNIKFIDESNGLLIHER